MLLGYLNPHHTDIPQKVLRGTVCNETMIFFFLDCVGGCVATQSKVCAPLLEAAGFSTIKENMTLNPRNLMMVFFPHRSFHTFYGALFPWKTQNVHEIMDGPSRHAGTNELAECVSGLLFTAGVPERGVDYRRFSSGSAKSSATSLRMRQQKHEPVVCGSSGHHCRFLFLSTSH